MLAVDIQQQRREFTESRHGARLIVDVDAIAFVGRNLTTNDEFAFFGVETEAIELVPETGFEDRFDDCAALSGTDHFRGGLRSRKQAESVDDDGFSGTCFAGEEIETFLKM